MVDVVNVLGRESALYIGGSWVTADGTRLAIDPAEQRTCIAMVSSHLHRSIPSRSDDLKGYMVEQISPLLVLTPYEAWTAATVFERLFPTDKNAPGAIKIGVLTYLDRALAGAYQDKTDTYGLAWQRWISLPVGIAAFPSPNAQPRSKTP